MAKADARAAAAEAAREKAVTALTTELQQSHDATTSAQRALATGETEAAATVAAALGEASELVAKADARAAAAEAACEKAVAAAATGAQHAAAAGQAAAEADATAEALREDVALAEASLARLMREAGEEMRKGDAERGHLQACHIEAKCGADNAEKRAQEAEAQRVELERQVEQALVDVATTVAEQGRGALAAAHTAATVDAADRAALKDTVEELVKTQKAPAEAEGVEVEQDRTHFRLHQRYSRQSAELSDAKATLTAQAAELTALGEQLRTDGAAQVQALAEACAAVEAIKALHTGAVTEAKRSGKAVEAANARANTAITANTTAQEKLAKTREALAAARDATEALHQDVTRANTQASDIAEKARRTRDVYQESLALAEANEVNQAEDLLQWRRRYTEIARELEKMRAAHSAATARDGHARGAWCNRHG